MQVIDHHAKFSCGLVHVLFDIVDKNKGGEKHTLTYRLARNKQLYIMEPKAIKGKDLLYIFNHDE